MAEIITRVDDIDGKSKLPADAVATEVLIKDPRLPEGGFHVFIDLSNNHLKALFESEMVVASRDNGREARPVTRRSTAIPVRESTSDAPAIRRWAETEEGASFLASKSIAAPAERGALRKNIIDAFDEFHSLKSMQEDADASGE